MKALKKKPVWCVEHNRQPTLQRDNKRDDLSGISLQGMGQSGHLTGQDHEQGHGGGGQEQAGLYPPKKLPEIFFDDFSL